MRLVFAGTPLPAALCLQALLEQQQHEIVGVMTRPDARRGRGRTLHPSPVKELALQAGIPVVETTTLRAGDPAGDAARAQLQAWQPDCVPVVAFGALIPKDLLSIAPHGFVNVHFSLLPRWRGAAPVQAAIAAGDSTTGVTTFRIDEGLDTGDVLLTTSVPIDDTTTAEALFHTLVARGGRLLCETMDQLAAGSVVAQPQTGEPTYAAKFTAADAQVDVTASATAISRQVRAFTPSPGAWLMWDDMRLKVADPQVVAAAEMAGTGAPGSIVMLGEKPVMRCGDGNGIAFGRLQPPGKPMMEAAAFVRGRREFERAQLS
ncbi:methionyl-tRNA formyltransferase [Corynebacterium choanae]|uniref:Methionyl-tRNA formyltransferase n=1 Tax=Corynebacterium choanae TaxID=1862358 RepID=A0A3G6J9S5_9CORY|nr:methionyl-tRNA formyltransferase [Corynebacterium choanae]AZA13648.1 Methionyl-tRNA formyltransferase [Corynebacterium choanae]